MQLEAFEDPPPLVIETFNFTDYFILLFELLFSRGILLVVYNGDIWWKSFKGKYCMYIYVVYPIYINIYKLNIEC